MFSLIGICFKTKCMIIVIFYCSSNLNLIHFPTEWDGIFPFLKVLESSAPWLIFVTEHTVVSNIVPSVLACWIEPFTLSEKPAWYPYAFVSFCYEVVLHISHSFLKVIFAFPCIIYVKWMSLFSIPNIRIMYLVNFILELFNFNTIVLFSLHTSLGKFVFSHKTSLILIGILLMTILGRIFLIKHVWSSYL